MSEFFVNGTLNISLLNEKSKFQNYAQYNIDSNLKTLINNTENVMITMQTDDCLPSSVRKKFGEI